GEGGVGANAQDLSNLNGKVLRLDTGAFNASGDRTDLVPADNPFAGQAGRRGEIWAYGLRNPFTGAIRPGTSTLFLNDVGGSAWEEVNGITRGGNFGWPRSEGMSSDPAHADPLHAYTHFPNGTSNPRVQAAVTGGVFYEGTQFPAEYRGKYFFADYLRKWIKVLDPATGRVTTLGDGLTGFLDLDVAPDGSLWGLEIGGNLYRIRYVGQANRPPTAAASADRTSGAVPLTISFSGAGSSDPDGDALTYTWDFGDGVTASGRDVAHTYKRAGRFTARLTVSDGEGGTDASEPITVTAGSSAPSATIGTPASGTLYRGGQTISFAGSGTDAEDGDLPASAFSWRIVFHHADHDHPFLGPINGVKSGSFRVPTGGEVDPDQWYRIHLTVTDSDGLTRTVNRDVRPRTSRVTLATNVDGLSLRLDGAAVAEGSSFVGVEGMVRSIGAPATQTLNGRTYQFVSWSDGKTATHNVTTPTSDTIYTATYRLTSGTSTTINATAAALVRGGAYANTNFGSATELVVKRHDTSADQVRESYLKFDLSRVTTITSAKLRLYGRLNDTGNPSVRTNIYSASNTSWPEGGLTWNNKPAAGSTLRGSFTASGTTARWYEIDLTSFLRAEKAAGRNLVTLVLKNPIQSASKTVINSDEAASNRPQLVVT
ncbi:MAG TPA: DNRLRE domain-containing protein, partial [Tepidisphaeraceae bacterium]|nr:DNRLRE domain-containing protein [Tepidisphaeraceae bacterium]